MVTKVEESYAGKTIEDFHLLNIGDLIPILVSAMQEQQEQIENLKERIKELENE